MYTTYFEWLKSQIEYVVSPISHDILLEELHSKPFEPLIERDGNRAVDGIQLRDEYYTECQSDIVIDSECSFLEFLIALSRRMNFIYARFDEDVTADCFWRLIENLGLGEIDDISYDERDGCMIDAAIERVNKRLFEPDGSGGLFPLQHPRTDQRNVEVWYQMNQYLSEIMTAEGRL